MNNIAKIVFKNVSKTYNGIDRNNNICALKNISFAVGANEILVVIGPSGCGKTTLLNLIAGFIKPTAGEVLFDGQAVAKPGIERTIIFQEYALFPWFSVRNNIEFGLVARKVSPKERRSISDEFLQLVNLKKYSELYPYQLSGGMKQRVALARALAVEPEVLLMDEPFGSLDAQTRDSLQQSLLEIWKIKKTTVIFVTHSIDEALILGNKILVLSRQPGQNRDYIDINRPFPRDLVSGPYFQEIKLKIRKILYNELRR